MWDNPRLLNLAANALYGAAAFIVLCIAIIAIVNSRLFPLRTVHVQNPLRHVDAATIDRALDGRVVGNFFGVDLIGVRNALQGIEWVRSVQVRRQWPDRLIVRIEEHEPLARWSTTQLVNTYGEVFAGRVSAALPQFDGPAGTAPTMTARYREFAQLVEPLEMQVTKLELTPRHAWQLELAGANDSRLAVMLGREETGHSATERLQRFVAMYPSTLAQLDRRSGHVDLRYPNGFALRVPGLEKLESQNKKAGSA